VGGVKIFLQARLWNTLSEHPGVGSAFLADHLHIAQRTISNVLQELRRRGAARREGSSHEHSVWYAVGEAAPYCKWGTNAASLKNLHVTLEERLARMGVKLKPPKVPTKTDCALQDCWVSSLNITQARD
jgi:hypothetical protein